MINVDKERETASVTCHELRRSGKTEGDLVKIDQVSKGRIWIKTEKWQFQRRADGVLYN